MASNKFKKDWQVLESFDEKGRIKKKLLYIGDYYSFLSGDTKASKKIFLIFTVCAWILFLLPLCFDSRSMRTAYIAVPYVADSLFLVFFSGYVISLFRVSDRFSEEWSEKFTKNMPACTFCILLIAAISAIGAVIAILQSVSKEDILFLTCDILLFICAFVLHRASKGLKTIKA